MYIEKKVDGKYAKLTQNEKVNFDVNLSFGVLSLAEINSFIFALYATDGETVVVFRINEGVGREWNVVGSVPSDGDGSASNEVATQGDV